MSANDWFAQTLADVVGLTVERPAVTETTAWGAAVLAGLGVGAFSDPADATAARAGGSLPAAIPHRPAPAGPTRWRARSRARSRRRGRGDLTAHDLGIRIQTQIITFVDFIKCQIPTYMDRQPDRFEFENPIASKSPYIHFRSTIPEFLEPLIRRSTCCR